MRLHHRVAGCHPVRQDPSTGENGKNRFWNLLNYRLGTKPKPILPIEWPHLFESFEGTSSKIGLRPCGACFSKFLGTEMTEKLVWHVV